jgi:hypothetical protein
MFNAQKCKVAQNKMQFLKKVLGAPKENSPVLEKNKRGVKEFVKIDIFFKHPVFLCIKHEKKHSEGQ